MSHTTIDQLVDQLKRGQLDRRGFIRQATAVGLSVGAAGTLATNAVAQDASPAAGTGAVALTSITREEIEALVNEEFPFTEPENTGGDVIEVNTTDIQTLNTILTTDVYSSNIAAFIYEGLVGSSPIDGMPAPYGGVSDYWEIADDNVTYTFYLNPNARFSDGTPLTAADIEFTYGAVLAEDSLSVRQATVAAQLKEINIVDDHTIQFVALAPSATFIQDIVGGVGILPKHIWESVSPADMGSDPGSTGQDPSRTIGSGPFKFVEWVQNDHVTLEKNADYWDPNGVPVIDRYIYRIVADGNAALQSVLTGESDINIGIPYPAIEPTRQSNPEVQLIEYETVLFNFYHCFQGEGSLFADVAVRQAMHYALDRELIAETAYMGHAIAAPGTQPVLSIAYAPDRMNTNYTYQPELAMQLLEEAGWVDSDGDGIREKDGVKFSFECVYSEGVVTYEQQIPYMQQAWREIGVEMIPTQLPFPTLSDQVESGNYQMCVQGFSWGIMGDQIIMFGCDYTPPAGFNRMHYCNPQYDELEMAAMVEVDPDARLELILQATNIVNDEAAVGVVVFRNDIVAAGPNVHNYFPNGYGELWSMHKVWVDAR